MNTFDPEDPKWNAYLLGECTEAEAKALETELEDNPEAQVWLEEMRGLEADLSRHFEEEPKLELQPLQKTRIRLKIPEEKPKATSPVIYALVATLALMLFGSILIPATTGALQKSDRREFTEAKYDADISVGYEAGVTGSRSPLNAGQPTDYSYRQPMEGPEEIEEEVQWFVADGAMGRTSSKTVRSESGDRLMEAQAINRSVVPVSEVRARRQLSINGGVPVSSAPEPAAPAVISPSQDEFDVLTPNPFRKVSDHPLSTFSIDVDTASYAVVRKMLKEGRLPPKDAVRIEEMINYFNYDYAAPTDGKPFAAHMQVAECPWEPEHHLVRVALKGEVIPAEERPALNLVYLLDVSGSMSGGNRLPLVKRAMITLVSQLDERDRVAIVVYAGAAGVVLPSTSGANDQAIIEALDRLNAGGSTAGGAGIKMAYKIAREQFVEGGVNRVILCTDGDFNVGLNQTGDLQKLIEKQAKSGVQLTVLGFGMGNYKDDTLETLSNKGNGNYAYIDDFKEARKVLVDDMLGTLVTIAKDVKIQVEFNPAYVEGYRLVGYENRMLKKEDFNNDNVDAGEIGAGHTVTALYEIVPTGKTVPGEVPAVDPLKYAVSRTAVAEPSVELLTLKVRHKEPDGDVSTKNEYPLASSALETSDPDQDFRFATAVAAFGLWLREPEFREKLMIGEVLELATSGKGTDPHGYRSEFIQLVRAAESIR